MPKGKRCSSSIARERERGGGEMSGVCITDRVLPYPSQLGRVREKGWEKEKRERRNDSGGSSAQNEKREEGATLTPRWV